MAIPLSTLLSKHKPSKPALPSHTCRGFAIARQGTENKTNTTHNNNNKVEELKGNDQVILCVNSNFNNNSTTHTHTNNSHTPNQKTALGGGLYAIPCWCGPTSPHFLHPVFSVNNSVV